MFSAHFDGEENSSTKLPIVSCAIMLAIGVASFVSISPPSESSSLVSDEGVAKEAVYLFTVEKGDSKGTMVVAEKDVEVILHDENSTYLISHTEEYGYLWRLFSSQFPMPDEKTTYKLLVHGSTN